MRRLLLSIATIGLMAAFSAPLFAQSGDDDGPGGGWTPGGNTGGGGPGPQDGPPQQQNPYPQYPQDMPVPGGAGGYGGPNGGGGSYGGGSSYPMPVEPRPQVPQQDPPPASGIPQLPPPGGNTQGVPNMPTPTTPATPQPTTGSNTAGTSQSSGFGAGTGNGSNGSNPGTIGGQPGVVNPGVVGAGNGILSSRDANKKTAMDRPVFGITVKMPSTGTTNNGSNGNGTPVGNGDLPPAEVPPTGPEGEDPPTFYGEPVQGKFCFILDASGSMAGARIASLRTEATNTIGALTDTDEFDCMAYGTQFADSTMELWGGLQRADDGNKTAATNFINGPACNPGAGTPTHRALEKACGMYSELDKMFLLTDGAPNATGSASQILAHFPAWWGHYPQETVLVAICIGGVEQAVNFMRDLAACDDSTGVFINRP
ncbi:MAG: VWA domain-containing protein [Planctomycetes bacterium]|nr:VWA domain-containing protein [Planctomycetota bacterium]